MSEKDADKPQISIVEANNIVSIQISASKVEEKVDSWSVKAQNAITELFTSVGIKEVYYIDDIFEVINSLPIFLAKVKRILELSKLDELKKSIPDINFDLPEEALDQEIRKVWGEANDKKQNLFLSKLIVLTGEDPDFKKDLQSKNKIEEYFPTSIQLNKLSPSDWEASKSKILQSLKEDRVLFLFDNIFTHSPSPISTKDGLGYIDEIIKSEFKDKCICGLLTHTVKKNDELAVRRKICNDRSIPIQNFFLLSKERSEQALRFADGIKKALLNSSCEIIKKRTIELILKAQRATLDALDNLDAYAFDHIVINSSFNEGIWEPETLFRLNDIVFKNNARKEIIKDKEYRTIVNSELEHARSIGRIKITESAYDDHLSLRNQELYDQGDIINSLNSPIENGDVFLVESGPNRGKYILVTQQCDLMMRNANDAGERKSGFATLLKINEISEKGLINEIQKYNKKDPFRPHFFASKFKLPYFELVDSETKLGIVDFDNSILIDMSVLDLAVFNNNGECKIDCNNLPDLNTQLQSSWRKRLEYLSSHYKKISDSLDALSVPISQITPSELQQQIQLAIKPTLSFLDSQFISMNYTPKQFDFGIRRIKRYKEPGSILLLNKYSRHLSRDAEEHDFAG